MQELCQRCRQFSIHAFARDTFPYRGFPLSAVSKSAKAGCSFCTVLNDLVNVKRKPQVEHPEPSLFGSWVTTAFHCLGTALVSEWVLLKVGRGHTNPETSAEALDINCLYAATERRFLNLSWIGPTAVFQVSADPASPAFSSGDVTGNIRVEGQNFTSEDAEKVLRWYRHCHLHHPQCNESLSRTNTFEDETSKLPTRCIDVRANVLRKTAGQTGKYLALSYRWKTENAWVKTTKRNYDCRTGTCGHDFCEHQAMLTPTLFRDVARIAAQLHINYIWIDAICIVQDDPDDWDRESRKMADYYQGAWITVVATSTASNGGLVKSLDLSALPRIVRLPYRDKDNTLQGYFYLQGSASSALSDDYFNNSAGSELYKRGWVFQETALARRRLQFMENGCFLRCKFGPAQSLTGQEAWNRDIEQDSYYQILSERGGYEGLAAWTPDTHEILKRWDSIVEQYSDTELTDFESDRLVALSGIAKEFDTMLSRLEQQSTANEAMRHQYLSGHWLPLCSLLWERHEVDKDCKGFKIRGLPTWSWTCLGKLKDNGVVSGVRVHWPGNSPGCNTRTVFVMREVRVVPVTKEKDWKPDFALAQPLGPSFQFGNESRFGILKLQGRLHRIYIDGTFNSKADLDAARKLTGCMSDLSGVSWMPVTISESSRYAAGWASLDEPIELVEHGLAGRPIYAFHIESLSIKTNMVLDLFGKFDSAHRVLYLRSVEIEGYELCFQRFGVGRLFGDEMLEAYESSSITDFWLV